MSFNQKGRSWIAAELGPGPFLSEVGFRWDTLTPIMHPPLRFAESKPVWHSFDQEKSGMALQPAG